MGLNLTILSYQDRIDFGIIGDREEVPDVWFLAEEVQHAFQELLDLVPREAAPKRRAAKKRGGEEAARDPRGLALSRRGAAAPRPGAPRARRTRPRPRGSPGRAWTCARPRRRSARPAAGADPRSP